MSASDHLCSDPVCDIDAEYRPSQDEEFMNQSQLEYFRRKLVAWRQRLVQGNCCAIQELRDSCDPFDIDPLDKASKESALAIELRAKDRARKLIAKIDYALSKIRDGTYGYCETTGKPISLDRLEARPIATLSIEAQQFHEKQERIQREGEI
ncbi:MAG: RNA polymerase-binding protein DksA [Holosporales bacterium]|jgi:DnaK suppressor protein|nr:RNA polymerase-binding protein DksA [Holosporales bacterium]